MKLSNIIAPTLSSASKIAGLVLTLLLCTVGVSGVSYADGANVYDEHCGSCHNGGFKGLMSRAPKMGKDSAWAELFANGLEPAQGKVLNGGEKHKAMGEEASLSADQVNEAIAYILSNTEVPGSLK